MLIASLTKCVDQEMRRYLLLFSCYFIFFITTAEAQVKGLGKVWNQIIEAPVSPESLRLQPPEEATYFLVKIKNAGNRTPEDLTIFREVGQGYFIVKIESSAWPNLEDQVEKVWRVNDQWKLSPNYFKTEASEKSFYSVRSTHPSATILNLSTIPSLQLTQSREELLRIQCSEEVLQQEVLSLPEVIYVGVESLHPKTESRVNDLNLNPNSINRIHHEYPLLNGEGMVLSIQEPLFDAEDIDLKGRKLTSSLEAEYVDPHTTEMATIAAGAGNSFITGKGVAWAAGITSSDFADVLPDADEDYRTLSAWVQNHSYGTSIENFYGTLAEAFDQSAHQNPALLHVISAGNEGQAAGSGVYDGITGYANLTGNYKGAKNILTIGAVDTLGRHMFFSSVGPAYDGRIKPELTAYSTAGSSNSTALVSGLSILLQQAYLEQHNSIPSSALLKAILINSATDAGPQGVDFLTGYGNVNGFRALLALQEGNYFSGTLSQGGKKEFTFSVPANVQNLKVTVVWNDPAALPNSATALVNDLDMELLNESGSSWLPWVLDHSPEKEKLEQLPTRKEDHLNNVEQISVEKPAPGNYTISLNGHNIPEGAQEFFIAYQWEEKDGFQWSFPTGSDNMPYNGETTGYFRWESTKGEEAYGRLEWSKDGGNTWELLEKEVLLKKELYRWNSPSQHTTAIARMIVGDQVYLTDQFTLTRPLQTGIGFNCGDSLLLQWGKKEHVLEYEVFSMGEEKMEKLGNTSDTTMVLDKNKLPSNYLAVRPVLEGGAKGLRSVAFDYQYQGNSCYLVSFYSKSASGEGVYLYLGLGSTYQLENLILERKSGGEWEELQTIHRPSTSQLQFLDRQPQQGLNTYRATLRLSNGEEIVSLSEHNYYLTEMPFLVFPNPVSGTEELKIYSKPMEEDFSFRLYNQTAKLVLERKIGQERAYIRLQGLPQGMYFYTLSLENQQYRGKLFIRE